MQKKGWGHEGPPYLELWQLERLIMAAPEPFRLLLRVIAYTGCRVSEALRLTARDIDFEGRTLKLWAGKKKGPEEHRFSLVLLLDPVTWVMLEKLEAKKGRLFNYSRQRVWQVIKEAGKAVGIDGLHPHILRDTFAVAWIKATGDLTTLQRQLRHKSYATTANKYLKYKTSDIAEQGVKLEDVILRMREQLKTGGQQ